MRRLVPIFLLAIGLMTGCGVYGTIRFYGAGDAIEPNCWIDIAFGGQKVDSYDMFFTAPSFDARVWYFGHAFEVSDNLLDNDTLTIWAHAQVVAYTETASGYWFKVELKGFRDAIIIRRALIFSTFSGDSWDRLTPEEFEGDIDTGPAWVNSRFVVNSTPDDSLTLCLDHIDSEAGLSAIGMTPEFYCEVTVRGNIALRVGPGVDRSIRRYAENGDIYGVLSSSMVDDAMWYEVDTESGSLWVFADDVDARRRVNPVLETITHPDIFFSQGDEPIELGCDDLPESSPPTVVLPAGGAPASNGNSGCDGFALLQPLDEVPPGESTYRWTPVAGANRYIVNFTDYQGNFAGGQEFSGAQTSAVINTSAFPTGSQLSVELVAMADQAILCRTASTSLSRTAQFVSTQLEDPEPTKEKKKEKKNGGYTPPDSDT